MNAPNPPESLLMPAFLERKEPLALFALWSSGRFVITKDDKSLSLSQDDLRELRRYFDLFEGETA